MNKKIALFSLMIGVSFAIFIFFKYNNDKKTDSLDYIYFLQVGAYKSYENALNKAKDLENYVIRNYDSIYRVYVGLTKEKKNINKLKEFFLNKGYNIYVRKENTSNVDLIKYIDKLDRLLDETEKKELIENILNNSINKYKETLL